MSYSSKGFHIPEYGDAADIPALVKYNVGILESLLDSFCMSFEARIIAENAGIYKSLGIGYYDCGTFTTAQTGEIIDGGGFEGSNLAEIDCGEFDAFLPVSCPCNHSGGNTGDTTATIIDGGDFASVGGAVIDGGDFFSTAGEVIDGGHYTSNGIEA